VVRDSKGNLYVADDWGARVRKIDPSGIITTVAGTGSAGYSGDGIPAISAELSHPRSVAVDSMGNLYIAEGARIRKVDNTGIISTVAGTGTVGFSGDGGPAVNAALSVPQGIAVQGKNLYIADTGNERIRKVDGSGIITTVAGTGVQGFSGDGGPATSAELFLPTGVTVHSGNLYIADKVNLRIRKVNGAAGFRRSPEMVLLAMAAMAVPPQTRNSAIRSRWRSMEAEICMYPAKRHSTSAK
jgi:hypothetical protein